MEGRKEEKKGGKKGEFEKTTKNRWKTIRNAGRLGCLCREKTQSNSLKHKKNWLAN